MRLIPPRYVKPFVKRSKNDRNDAEAIGEAAKTYKPSDAIFEPGNAAIEKFDNGSATEPAVFIANYLLGADDKEIIHFMGSGK